MKNDKKEKKNEFKVKFASFLSLIFENLKIFKN
jgi:hypothetical protein